MLPMFPENSGTETLDVGDRHQHPSPQVLTACESHRCFHADWPCVPENGLPGCNRTTLMRSVRLAGAPGRPEDFWTVPVGPQAR